MYHDVPTFVCHGFVCTLKLLHRARNNLFVCVVDPLSPRLLPSEAGSVHTPARANEVEHIQNVQTRDNEGGNEPTAHTPGTSTRALNPSCDPPSDQHIGTLPSNFDMCFTLNDRPMK